MLFTFRIAACMATSVLMNVASQAEVRDSGKYYDWSEEISEDSSTWAGYFRKNARLKLGPERRLPNGVSWRLLIDQSTGVPTPRVTWMPNRERMPTANRLLDSVQGGEMLVFREEEHRRDDLNRERKAMGARPIDEPPVSGWDAELTYVGPHLMSMVATARTWGEGKYSTYGLMRGLVFDLQAGTMAHVSACPGDSEVYGFQPDYTKPPVPSRFIFRYGELLDLCDPARYRDFIALVKRAEGAGGQRHTDPSESIQGTRCTEYPASPVFQEAQEYILYLTFDGLAVQATGRHCPSHRTPDNPVIVPYRELTPLMTPGPMRDELLSLH